MLIKASRFLPTTMPGRNRLLNESSSSVLGGLFLEPGLPSSFFARLIDGNVSREGVGADGLSDPASLRDLDVRRNRGIVKDCRFFSVSLREGCVEKREFGSSEDGDRGWKKKKVVVRRGGGSVAALNTSKHLWAGAIAAMVSRTFVAPLERLKLEYMVRGEQKNIFELIKKIALTQGLRGFWKGNLVNILRTAPFKAINFCAYDTYRKQFLKLSGNDETTNSERFIAGAAAGMTATILCLPLDTIRIKLVAQGGESLGSVIGAFRHLIQTEGFFSLYKGIVPSILSMAPSGAVFYGVYDILKSAYMHSPEGRKRIQRLSQQGNELNALKQLELGPMRTLLYGALSGACAEAATYPFEVVRRKLQLQDQAKKLSAYVGKDSRSRRSSSSICWINSQLVTGSSIGGHQLLHLRVHEGCPEGGMSMVCSRSLNDVQ